MKYDSLKMQTVKSFKIKALDGGINTAETSQSIADNQISMCKNMWYKDARFQTRPGFKGNYRKAIDTSIYGSTESLKYNVTDTEVYIDGVCYRIAVANVLADDYAHYVYVYLIDPEDNITSIGEMTFLRVSSSSFSVPNNILFFNGKPNKGAGIYAFVTLVNQYNYNQKYYYIYELDSNLEKWERVYDYYVPTIFINGRGNKYQVAKTENGLSYPMPKTLESQNMLNGRFNVYFTSDGYSNSFKLPFTKLANEKVVCRIYYTLVDYLEWEFGPTAALCVKKFMGQEVSGILDREKGVVYFVCDNGNFPIPIIDTYHENNIKITASKEIKDGLQKVVYSTCSVRMNTKLLVAGGMDGNTVYTSDYENPLYFPFGSAVKIGESDNSITALSVQQDKVLAFKQHSLYRIGIKDGSIINETSLLIDNDHIFKNCDSFNVEELSNNIGCSNKKTVYSCGYLNFWQGTDTKIYACLGKEIKEISENVKSIIPKYVDEEDFAIAWENYYFLVSGKDIFVFDCKDFKKIKVYKWETPECASVESGYYHDGKCKFLCTGEDSTIAYIATLNGDTDSYLFYDNNELISQLQMPIKNSVATKLYPLSHFRQLKNIDSVFLLVAAKGKVEIGINDLQMGNINFGFSNEIYDKCEYKMVKLTPHLYGVDDVCLTLSSDRHMSIGEIEILYRVTG